MGGRKTRLFLQQDWVLLSQRKPSSRTLGGCCFLDSVCVKVAEEVGKSSMGDGWRFLQFTVSTILILGKFTGSFGLLSQLNLEIQRTFQNGVKTQEQEERWKSLLTHEHKHKLQKKSTSHRKTSVEISLPVLALLESCTLFICIMCEDLLGQSCFSGFFCLPVFS